VKKSALETPMMRHFLAVKAQHPDAIVFYRMGDFYEMFLRDAEVAAPLLDIALTTRDKGKEDPVPMCGIPVHSAEGYIQQLAERGHRVAICEQVEDPKAAGGKRLVKREVVEVVTPGLVGDPQGIESRRELSLAALLPGDAPGLAVLDASTGDFRATLGEGTGAPGLPSALEQELARIRFRAANPPVVTNVEATPNADAARMPELLATQVTAPVRFNEMVTKMAELGVDRFLEIGAGRVLTGLVARIGRRYARANLSSHADLATAGAFLTGEGGPDGDR